MATTTFDGRVAGGAAVADESAVPYQWAYLAGIVAVLLGATLVFLCFPKRDRELELLAEYARQDAGTTGAGGRAERTLQAVR